MGRARTPENCQLGLVQKAHLWPELKACQTSFHTSRQISSSLSLLCLVAFRATIENRRTAGCGAPGAPHRGLRCTRVCSQKSFSFFVGGVSNGPPTSFSIYVFRAT